MKKIVSKKFLCGKFVLSLSTGQALIEAMVALAAIVVAIAAIAIVVTLSIRNSTFVKAQNVAAKHAQEGIEYLKGVHDSNGTVKLVASDRTLESLGSSTYCLDTNNVLSVQYGGTCQPNIDSRFVRSATFRQGECGATGGSSSTFVDGIEVTVDVRWSSGRCQGSNAFCHESSLVSCFAKKGVEHNSFNP